MDRKQELEQQLWELVYELLPEAEAVALRRRITSEPDVARAYADVKLQSELVAQALRYEAEQIKFTPPAEDRDAAAAEPVIGPVSRVPAGRSRLARVVHGVLSLAAATLLCIVGYAYLGPRSPFHRGTVAASRDVLNQQLVQTTLFGPERLPPRLPGHLAIHTRTADGAPRPVTVAYRVYDRDAKLLASDRAQTDGAGWLQIRTPPIAEGSELRLEVEPQAGPPVPLKTVLAADRERLALHLATDLVRYRPGDTVRYRSLALAPCARQPAREVTVAFGIQNAEGAPLPGSEHTAVSEQGVASGEFALPAEVATGRYLLVARSPRDEYAPAQRSFSVQPRPAPTPRRPVEFARDRYAPGDEVVVDLALRDTDGKPAARAPLRLYAEVHGQVPLNLYTATDDAGTYQLKFTLPQIASVRGAKLAVTVGDPPREHLSETIPVGSDDQVAGKPDGAGRGADRLGAGDQPLFALETESLVVGPDQPVALEVRAAQTDGPLFIVASADGVPVGQAIVPRESFQAQGRSGGVSHVAVPVADEAQGLLRLTAYDLKVQPPQPVAERIVLRQARQELQILGTDLERKVAPGEEVQFELSVRDEADRPHAAALGVQIVQVADSAKDSGLLATSMALQPERLLAAQPLAESAELGKALAGYAAPFDALAGERRELRERLASVEEAEKSVVTKTAQSLHESSGGAATSKAESVSLAALADNTDAVRAALDGETAALHAVREIDFHRVGQILIAGAIALLLGLGGAALARLGTRIRVWAPVLLSATASLLIGMFWVGARVDDRGEVAWWSPLESQADRAVAMQSEAAKETPAAAAPAARASTSGVDMDRKYSAPASRQEADEDHEELRRQASGKLAEAEQPMREAVSPPMPALGASGADAPQPPAPAEPAPAAAPRPTPPPAAPLPPAAPAPALSDLAAGPSPAVTAESTPAAGPVSQPSAPEPMPGLPAPKPVSGPPAPVSRPSPTTPPPSPATVTPPAPTAEAAPVVEGRSEKRLEDFGKVKAAARRDRTAADKSELARKLAPAKPPRGGGGMGGAHPVEPKTDQLAQLADSQAGLRAAAEAGGGAAAGKRSSNAFAYRDEIPARLKTAGRAGAPPGAVVAEEKKQRGMAERELGVRLNRYLGRVYEEPRTIYWQPLLRTAPDGRATVRFTLPNQPGTYRVEIVGHSDGRLGFASSTLTAE